MKEKFYVFTDIDGTLTDIENTQKMFSSKELSKLYLSKGQLYYERAVIKKESVQALDFLLSSLENQFDTQLIISSDIRVELEPLVDKLKELGLKYPKQIYKTPKIHIDEQGKTYTGRALEILAFLKNKPNAENLVIIDDSCYDLNKYFSPDKIIKTDCRRRALDNEHVNNFLLNLPENSKNK